MTDPRAQDDCWLDRDLSILAFNERVLEQAKREDLPLLERLRYLCIVSSNLDEFFEVRAILHLENGEPLQGARLSAAKRLSASVHRLVEQQYRLFNDMLSPAFAKGGTRIFSHGERSIAQQRWVKSFFEREVRPLLLPVVLDPAHPFPQVANKSLNFIVRLDGTDAFGRVNEIGIVKVPRSLPRLIRLPAGKGEKAHHFVSISSVIRSHLQDLFPARKVGQFSQFRVTRHSDLAVDAEDSKDLRVALREGLSHRHFGRAVRLEISAGCSEYLADFLLSQFKLTANAMFRVHGPVNLVRMRQLIELVSEPAWVFQPFKPGLPDGYLPHVSILEQLRKNDLLLHQPYQSFDLVLEFLREAVQDPDVVAIKQTVYRTGTESALMDLLQQAVNQGKEVTVVLELKARFDEEANINWAERLEQIGAQVVYGVVGLKTHAKMLLVTRREGRQVRRYAHLSTGNYNPVTARLYTDISHLTSNPSITKDMESVFGLLANQSKLPRLSKLWLAPFSMQRKLVELVSKTAGKHSKRHPARVVLKMNALTDEVLMQSLCTAAEQGAQVDLIVRGACMLPPRRFDSGGEIRIRSIIGRFLEHSRVFYFQVGNDEQLYLSSADWMNRNMLRRIELAWPIEDPNMRSRIVSECLDASLADCKEAWLLQQSGSYALARLPASVNGRRQKEPGSSAQATLMARLGGKP